MTKNSHFLGTYFYIYLLLILGELTPILVQMVKSANTNGKSLEKDDLNIKKLIKIINSPFYLVTQIQIEGLLDNDCDSSKIQNL
jgi:hypothetical protein